MPLSVWLQKASEKRILAYDVIKRTCMFSRVVIREVFPGEDFHGNILVYTLEDLAMQVQLNREAEIELCRLFAAQLVYLLVYYQSHF